MTALLLALPRQAPALLPNANPSGEVLYQRECAPCHGVAGRGDGPEAATFLDKPRDLSRFAVAEPTSRIVDRVRRSRLRILAIDQNVVATRRKQMPEELVGYLQKMQDLTAPVVLRGANVYSDRCEICHGPYGRPLLVNPALGEVRRTTPARADFQKTVGDPELLAHARGDGHPKVAGFEPVASAEDAGALIAYLRVLSPGFERYSLWCAGCHGDAGNGDGVFATGVDKPNVVLDEAYLAAQDPAELRRKVMHVLTDPEPAVPHYQRSLSAGQTRSILVALRNARAAEPLPSAGAETRATPIAPPATPAANDRAPRPSAPEVPRDETAPPAPTPPRSASTPSPVPGSVATPKRTPRPASAVKTKPGQSKPKVKSTPKPAKAKPKPKAKPTPTAKRKSAAERAAPSPSPDT